MGRTFLATPLLLMTTAVACAAHKPPSVDHVTAPRAPTAELGVPSGLPLTSRPELFVRVAAPSRTRYQRSAMGPGRLLATLTVTNGDTRVAEVGVFRASFVATREGVEFPCHEALAPPLEREPALLDPGESYSFDRAIDCEMPVPGRYDLGVYVRVGRPRDALADFAGALTVDVEAGEVGGPMQHPRRPGLWFTVPGPLYMRPWLSARVPRLVVGIVNAGPRPVPVGFARVQLAVRRHGAPVECDVAISDMLLPAPATVDPGRTHFVRVPVPCDFHREGTYVVDVRIGVEGLEPVSPGQVSISVAHDPTPVTPSLP